MDPCHPLGRGRGRGRRVSDLENVDSRPGTFPATARLPSLPSTEEDTPGRSTLVSSIGRGRGRGRGSSLTPSEASDSGFHSFAPSTDDPEESDFLVAFRKLQLEKSKGRGRGRGFPFNSLPSAAETQDSGLLQRDFQSPGTSLLQAQSFGRGKRTSTFKTLSPPEAQLQESDGEEGSVNDVGSEDYSNLEKAAVVKRGVNGQQVPITCNYLKFIIEKQMGIFEYHVEFEPPVDSFRIKRKIICSLEPELGHGRNFDGAKLYLATHLKNKITSFSTYSPELEETITVKIKFVKTNSLLESIHFYNVLFRRIMECLGLVEMKRNFYDHRTVFDLPKHKLEIWPGYVTAIDEYEGGLMLCCDSSFRVLRTSTVLDVWENFQDARDGDKVTAQKNFEDYIIGKIIVTRYNSRNYRVDDVDWRQSPTSSFTKSGGQEITYMEYYRTAHSMQIRNTFQPLLVHRPRLNQQTKLPHGYPASPVCLVPELCFVTGLDSDITSNYSIMKDMAVHTKLTPAQRSQGLIEFVRKVNGCDQTRSMLAYWGLSLQEACVRLEGRILTLPQVQANKHYNFQPGSAEFGDKIMSNSILKPVEIRNWLLLFSRNDRDKANRLIDEYHRVTRSFGISFPSFNERQLINVGRGTSRDFGDALKKFLNPSIQFIVAITPSSRNDVYATIKRECTSNRAVPSQIILSRTLSNEKNFRNIMQKVALQINCKLGGSLWSIRIPLPEKIMFVGMDAYHDPKIQACSVTAIVASLNRDHTKYCSMVIFQARHQEIADSLQPIVIELLRAYAEESGGFPDRVIVWRDGVSDGQLELTKTYEVTEMMNAFRQLSINPKFTFCIVQKRINTRLYLQQSSMTRNPAPGTVVDHTITQKYMYDFFLVSQLVREGTGTPSHYIVLEDTANVSPDLIQKFAFATTFMYYNWFGSIRVPAMCQYAHKLAYLVGQHIQARPAVGLAKQLYYL